MKHITLRKLTLRTPQLNLRTFDPAENLTTRFHKYTMHRLHMYMLQKILRRLTLRHQQLKLRIKTLILWKTVYNDDIRHTCMCIYMYNRKICGIKPAEHTINDA